MKQFLIDLIEFIGYCIIGSVLGSSIFGLLYYWSILK